MSRMIIAIDGPAGAGKSTIARKLARQLNLGYMDTGAMYRALTLQALREHLDLEDENVLASMAANMGLEIVYTPRKRPTYRVLLNGEDITSAIRSREVSAHVSQVSSHPRVRREMIKKQQHLAMGGGMVVEGRDVGTVVFPTADLKFFVTASTRERARRRYQEMKKEGYDVTLHTIQQEMVRRDNLDSTRKHNPLRRAADALLVDTTDDSVSQVVGKLTELVRGWAASREAR